MEGRAVARSRQGAAGAGAGLEYASMHASRPAAAARTQRPFEIPVRVYYEDTDAGGVVYYASYLRFLERARTEWLRNAGFEQQKIIDKQHLVFVVKRIEADYHAPGRLDDELRVEVAVDKLGNASLVFGQRVTRGETVLLDARVTVVCVDIRRMKPAPIPAPMREKLEESLKAAA